MVGFDDLTMAENSTSLTYKSWNENDTGEKLRTRENQTQNK